MSAEKSQFAIGGAVRSTERKKAMSNARRTR